MNYQNEHLPEGAKFAASSPTLTEKTIPAPILKKHMAPHGKYGFLVVTQGALKFVWEDSGEILDAAPEHPIVIFPERYHHVEISGPVEFRIEFYEVPQDMKQCASPDSSASRPGEQFLGKTACEKTCG